MDIEETIVRSSPSLTWVAANRFARSISVGDVDGFVEGGAEQAERRGETVAADPVKVISRLHVLGDVRLHRGVADRCEVRKRLLENGPESYRLRIQYGIGLAAIRGAFTMFMLTDRSRRRPAR